MTQVRQHIYVVQGNARDQRWCSSRVYIVQEELVNIREVWLHISVCKANKGCLEWQKFPQIKNCGWRGLLIITIWAEYKYIGCTVLRPLNSREEFWVHSAIQYQRSSKIPLFQQLFNKNIPVWENSYHDVPKNYTTLITFGQLFPALFAFLYKFLSF